MAEAKQRDIWLKAAVVGSLWGASEIVLGSFLHNLKIPFSGNMLTAIAIVIMIAGHRLWPERGLVIRAGLICAALKTLSPSASILGPMMAITMQAVIMEMLLLVGRRTWAGYVVGGGLAMAWNLFHRIFTSLLLYGGTLIELYKSLIDLLVRQTGWQTEGYLAPILVLTSIFFVTGAASAVAGIYISLGARKHSIQWKASQSLFPAPQDTGKAMSGARILIRIILLLAVIIAAMTSLSRLPMGVSAILLSGYLILVWHYESRLIRRFAYRKGFWISMSIMLLLSGLLLGNPGEEKVFSLYGVRAGVEMMMRAMYVITGFGLLSKELRRQSVMQWFESKNMKQFLNALRIAFQTTPILIESIPGKQAWRKPAKVLASMIGSMEYSLDQVRMMHAHQHHGNQTNSITSDIDPAGKPKFSKVFIITGNKGQGKTTLLTKIIDALKQNGVNVSGILAPELLENGERVGYYVHSIESGEQMVLCRITQRSLRLKEKKKIPYVFNPRAIAFGEKCLTTKKGLENQRQLRLKIIDELGPVELKGQGWADAMDQLQATWQGPMIWVVRESLIDAMLQRWPADEHRVFHVQTETAETITQTILSEY